MKKYLMIVPVVALAAGTTGCATKKFVRTEVGSVNEIFEEPLHPYPNADRQSTLVRR